uniref:GTPase rho n=1 Tax=Riptortus pedestris TaxID=329032 RepID=R4WJ13_RIPPE|nr:GTPase rho [Riptortus pedestris]
MALCSKKIFVIGDGGCGKTSIIKTFCNKEGPLLNLPTTLEKHVTDVEVKGKKYELHIWETLCTHHYRVSGLKTRQSIYKDTDLVIIVYDISSRKTLESVIQKWHREVHLFCPKRTPIILVGNKKDTRSDGRVYYERTVEYKEGQAVASAIGAACFLECSALSKEGIREVFVSAGTLFHEDPSCILF